MSDSNAVKSHPHPTPATRQHVLAACGNQCAFPGCSEHIFDLEHVDLVGDIAHIKGRSPGAARYDKTQSAEDNRSFMNLILMCKKHHTIIDGNKAHLYPVSRLREMKFIHETKIANDGDRSWIKPPSSTHRWNIAGEPLHVSWWVDRTGKIRLYSKEQLAVCNILLEINLSLGRICSLIENLPKIGDEVTVGDLLQQDWAKFKTSAPSVYGHFAQLMAAAPDITFSEFIGFVVQGNDPTALADIGAERLQKVIESTDIDVKSHFRSDKVE